MDNDTSWCPVCDRAIQPKRYQVPVAPPPPPSSPVRRTKSATRQRAGLVQGTGRVKPNGALKEQPQQPVRLRTVIDQGPTPLYCSDKCHQVDSSRGLSHNLSDSSLSSITSAATSATTASSSDASSSSSNTTKLSKSLAIIAEKYHWAPLPPAPPVLVDEPAVRVTTAPAFDDGILMAARRIKSYLPPPQRRDALGHIIPPKEPHPIIPGWNDGSNGWRSSVYGLTAAASSSSVQHKSFATRSSRGVQSTFSAPTETTIASSNTISADDAERMDKWNSSFRRTSTPISSSPTSPISSASYPPSRRERPLLHPGAEGKLLVPNVMMKVNSSSASLSSQCSAPASHNRFRSPLSHESSSDDDGEASSDKARPLRSPKRPTVETRSWSYDNIKTYPIMRLPPKTKTEKRKEIRVVDGEEVEVEYEVEVEIYEKPKRLFLFASSMPPAVRS
ncbi:hypothetical protein H0H87_008703 [Tephrocybe sp. NHM501043]|nr:hypothetical protein H0H87_008703 [Tephrocybe sp. NHM501043]